MIRIVVLKQSSADQCRRKKRKHIVLSAKARTNINTRPCPKLSVIHIYIYCEHEATLYQYAFTSLKSK